MKKTLSNESRAKKAIRMINRANATWEDVSRELELSISYIQSIVKAHYKSEKAYNNLLAKARANKKAKAEAKDIVEPLTEGEIKEVILTETGYLMETGCSIFQESLDIYIPQFCLKELDKLSNTYTVADEFLTIYWSTKGITSINLRGQEWLLVDPEFPVKDRSKGVVAVAVDLHYMGFKVRLLTNSREIEELAQLQDCNIDVVRVAKR